MHLYSNHLNKFQGNPEQMALRELEKSLEEARRIKETHEMKANYSFTLGYYQCLEDSVQILRGEIQKKRYRKKAAARNYLKREKMILFLKLSEQHLFKCVIDPMAHCNQLKHHLPSNNVKEILRKAILKRQSLHKKFLHKEIWRPW